MTRWTKPEDYTDKGIAWTMLRERLSHGPAIGYPSIEEMLRAALPPNIVIEPKAGARIGMAVYNIRPSILDARIAAAQARKAASS